MDTTYAKRNGSKTQTEAGRPEQQVEGTKHHPDANDVVVGGREGYRTPVHGQGALLDGWKEESHRNRAPRKKPLPQHAAVKPCDRDLSAESKIKDMRGALNAWYRDVIQGRNARHPAAVILMFLISHCKWSPAHAHYLQCWHTTQYMSDVTGLYQRGVKRGLAELKKAGIVVGERKRLPNGKYGRNYYYSLCPPDLTKYAPIQSPA